MTTHADPDRFPEEVVVDSYVLKDACWLLTSVEEFARFGDLGAVNELLKFADPKLSPDELADIAGEFASRLRRRIEAAR